MTDLYKNIEADLHSLHIVMAERKKMEVVERINLTAFIAELQELCKKYDLTLEKRVEVKGKSGKVYR